MIRALLCGLLLCGCFETPQGETPFRALHRAVDDFRAFLGLEPKAKSLPGVETSRVDTHRGRRRRRLDLSLQGAVADHEFRDELRRRLGTKAFTDGLQVGAVLIWDASDDRQPMAVGVYSRDGLGWTGERCDHLRVAARGDEGFTALDAEVRGSDEPVKTP